MTAPQTLHYHTAERVNFARLALAALTIGMLGPSLLAWFAGERLLQLRLYLGRSYPVITALPLLFMSAGIFAGTLLLCGVIPRPADAPARSRKRTLCLALALLNALLLLASSALWGIYEDLNLYGVLTPTTRSFWALGSACDWLAMFPQLLLLAAALLFLKHVAARQDVTFLLYFSTIVMGLCTAMLAAGIALRALQILPEFFPTIRPHASWYTLFDAGFGVFHVLQIIHWSVIATWALRRHRASL